MSEEIATETWAHHCCQSEDVSRDVRLLTLQGRVGILGVHSRNKKVEEGLDYHKVARATAGFTGAELMNLMNTAAIVAVRRGAKIITEADVFQVGCDLHTLLLYAARRSHSPGGCIVNRT